MLNIDISKQLPEFQLNFSLERQNGGEAVILTGPSGAGKTTLLRCISGLETPNSGRISANGKVFFDSQRKINQVPAGRGIGFCFQDYLLFPHLTAKENILYGLKKHRHTKDSLNKSHQITEKLKLNNRILDSYPDKLSGGEKQRIALARALLRGENLLLLDEPLNALDKNLRQHVAEFIRDWIQDHQVPAIIVSHMEEDSAFTSELQLYMIKGECSVKYENCEYQEVSGRIGRQQHVGAAGTGSG